MSKATTVTTTALGVVTPWSAPVRLLAARGLLSARRKRAEGRQRSIPVAGASRRARKGSRVRAVVIVGAIGAVAAAGSVVVLRARTHTPPPVAPTPPRVADVPTADTSETAPTAE